MTPEQKLDRLERIAKLFVRAGLRERRRTREIAEKVDMLINEHTRHEDELARTKTRMENELQGLRIRNENELLSMKNELHETRLRNEDDIRKMRDELDKRSHEVFELFRMSNEQINRLADAQMISDRKLNLLIERS